MLDRPGLGLGAVRPPALPQHRRRARRRRHGAAPQAPRHRRRHRAGAGPDHRRQPPLVRGRPADRHRPRRGRVGPQPGLRRGAAARARQLPELRQPGAPRGDVGALGGHRRDGRGLRAPSTCRWWAATSASTTRRAAATSTPPRSSACSAWSTPWSGGRPGGGWCRAGGCWCSARMARSAWPGRAGRGRGRRRAARCRRSTCRRSRPSPRSCGSSSPTTCCRACTTWPTVAWRWRWPRWWPPPRWAPS